MECWNVVVLWLYPSQCRSGDDAAVLGVNHHGCCSESGSDVLELITDGFVWNHVLKKIQDQVEVAPVFSDSKDDFGLSG